MTVPAKSTPSAALIESVLIKGDLKDLSPAERSNYYLKVCESIGLNPLTRPLEYITLNGKLTLYAKRDCADQLRKINGISIKLVSQEATDELLTVHAQATDTTGRTDEDLGVVAFPATLKGEARANAILKCVTKAKRRVTLSISGLGFLDETEIEDIPATNKRPAPPAPNVLTPHPPPPPHPPAADGSPDPTPGGSPAPSPSPMASGAGPDERALDLAARAREAAQRGRPTFKAFYNARTPQEQAVLNDMSEELVALMGERKR